MIFCLYFGLKNRQVRILHCLNHQVDPDGEADNLHRNQDNKRPHLAVDLQRLKEQAEPQAERAQAQNRKRGGFIQLRRILVLFIQRNKHRQEADCNNQKPE